jgi:hypothetical protein
MMSVSGFYQKLFWMMPRKQEQPGPSGYREVSGGLTYLLRFAIGLTAVSLFFF